MVGEFCIVANTLRFQPRHPFAAGVTYTFITRAINGDAEQARATLAFPLVKPALAPGTVVTAIYPTAAMIPRNALRFYVHFSAPMSEGFAAGAIALRDTHSGERLADTFLPMQPELWDPSRTRLTLLLDPGRIKRGLASHVEAGYPLSRGRSVEIIVDQRFQDAAGTELVQDCWRGFHIGPALHGRLRPQRWAVVGPIVGTREPVRLRADRPLDHALAERCLTVIDQAGIDVAGRGVLEIGDQDWTFVPEHPWAESRYTLLVRPELEDVAGNSPGRAFDRDLDLPDDDVIAAGLVAIELRARRSR
jgi:hypothetical protein